MKSFCEWIDLYKDLLAKHAIIDFKTLELLKKLNSYISPIKTKLC